MAQQLGALAAQRRTWVQSPAFVTPFPRTWPLPLFSADTQHMHGEQI